MAADRTARAIWNGTLVEGNGQVGFESSGALPTVPVTWAARTEAPGGKTSPEELLAAAMASCFAMAFSSTLAKRGTPATSLDVTATATFDQIPGGWGVTTMRVSVTGEVPGMEAGDFEQAAREQACPISNAIKGNVEVSIEAKLTA